MDTIVFEAGGEGGKKEDDFQAFLDRVGKKAEENGLSEEKLDQLLHED